MKRKELTSEQFLRFCEGETGLSMLQTYIVKEEIHIGDISPEELHFGDGVFEKEVFFDKTELVLINLGKSAFLDTINFGDAKVGELYFDKSSANAVYFGSMQVDNLYFDDVTVKEWLRFDRVKIEGDLDFGKTSFLCRIDCGDNYRLRQDLHMAFPGVQIFGNYKKVPFARN